MMMIAIFHFTILFQSSVWFMYLKQGDFFISSIIAATTILNIFLLHRFLNLGKK